MDLTFNYLQWLICHKIQPTKIAKMKTIRMDEGSCDLMANDARLFYCIEFETPVMLLGSFSD